LINPNGVQASLRCKQLNSLNHTKLNTHISKHFKSEFLSKGDAQEMYKNQLITKKGNYE